MDDNEKLELERYRLTEQVKDSVEKELKKRYSWYGVVALAIISTFIYLTVRDVLTNVKDEIATARGAQESAAERLVAASIKMDEITMEVAKSKTDFENTRKLALIKIDEAKSSAEKMKVFVETANKGNIAIANKFQKDLSDVSDIVKKLVAQSDENKEKINLIAKVNEAEHSIARSDQYIRQIETTFQSFLNPVLIQEPCTDNILSTLLISNGYKVEIDKIILSKNYFVKENLFEPGTAIRLLAEASRSYYDILLRSIDCSGDKAIRFSELNSLSAESCIRLIRLVKSYWPDLKYVFSVELEYDQESSSDLAYKITSSLSTYSIYETVNYSAMIGTFYSDNANFKNIKPLDENDFEVLFNSPNASEKLRDIIPVVYMKPKS